VIVELFVHGVDLLWTVLRRCQPV